MLESGEGVLKKRFKRVRLIKVVLHHGFFRDRTDMREYKKRALVRPDRANRRAFWCKPFECVKSTNYLRKLSQKEVFDLRAGLSLRCDLQIQQPASLFQR